MPVALVRNLSKGPTVFTDKNSDTAIEWQGAGDPVGEDIQQVPVEVLSNVAFLKTVRRGLLEVIADQDEDVTAEWEKAQASFAKRAAVQPDVLDRSEAEPIVVVAEGDLVGGKRTEAALKVSVGAALPSAVDVEPTE